MAFLLGGDLIEPDKILDDKGVDNRLFPIGGDHKEQITIAKRQKIRIVADSPTEVDSTNPITFRIPSQSGSAIDLSGIYWSMLCRLIRQDDFDSVVAAPMTEDSKLTTTVMGCHALFAGVKIKISGKDVSDSSTGDFLYPYNAFFKKCLMEDKGSSHYSGWLTDLENCDVTQPYMNYGTVYGVLEVLRIS